MTSTFTLNILLTLATLLKISTAICTREALLASAQAYINAQKAGNASALSLSPNFKYLQNNKERALSAGILSTPYTLDLVRSTVDTVACASYTMWISTSSSKPYVVGTQLRHENDTATISVIDTIAATTGDLFFDAKKTLGYIQKEDWTPINDTAGMPSRELLKSVGDAYLDMWTDKGAADRIPWGTSCERVEGSQYTNPCGKNLPRGGSAKPNGMRR